MQIQLNGQKEEIKEGTTLKSLLHSKDMNPKVVACELNLKIIRRAQLERVILKEGDTLEIIRMIGGG